MSILSVVQRSVLHAVHRQQDQHHGKVVPNWALTAHPSTLAALVRNGYLEARTHPHAGYALTARSERLFATQPAGTTGEVQR